MYVLMLLFNSLEYGPFKEQSTLNSNWLPMSKAELLFSMSKIRYRTRAIIGRSRFEAALIYKPRILSLKNEEFPFLVHKLSAI